MKGRKHRDAGGKVPEGKEAMKAGGNPYVFEEVAEKKSGGGVKHLGKMDGAKSKHGMHRPGRKMGGRVGANTSPLSTAHKGVSGH